MRNRLVTILAAGVLWIAAWGCTVQPAAPYPDVASFCDAKAKAICEASAICAVDVNQCQTVQVSQCNTVASGDTQSGTRKYNSDNAKTCIDALNSAFGNNASKVLWSAWVGQGSLTDKCERVFVGAAGMNQSCKSDYDCANDLICSPAQPGASTLVCAKATPINAGDFCAAPGSECPADYYCAPPQTGAAAQCIQAAAAGQSCSDSVPCVSSQRCSGGLCVARGGGRAACMTDSDCGSMDPFCDIYAGNICTLGLTFATGATDCTGFLLGMAAAPTVNDGGTD